MSTFLHDSNLFPNVVHGATHNWRTILTLVLLAILPQQFDFIARISSPDSFDRLRSIIELRVKTKSSRKNKKQTNSYPLASTSQM